MNLFLFALFFLFAFPVFLAFAESEDKIEQLNQKGKELLDGKPGEAILYFDKVLEIDPNNVKALINKGVAVASLGEFVDALQYFDKVLEIDPNNIKALNNKGTALIKLSSEAGPEEIRIENLKEALKYFDKALEIDPDYRIAEHNVAFLEYYRYNYPDAMFEAIVRNSQGDLVAYLKHPEVRVLDHEVAEKEIELWPTIKIISRNGTQVEVKQFHSLITIPEEASLGVFGVKWRNTDQWLIRTHYHSPVIDPNDTIEVIFTIFKPLK